MSPKTLSPCMCSYPHNYEYYSSVSFTREEASSYSNNNNNNKICVTILYRSTGGGTSEVNPFIVTKKYAAHRTHYDSKYYSLHPITWVLFGKLTPCATINQTTYSYVHNILHCTEP